MGGKSIKISFFLCPFVLKVGNAWNKTLDLKILSHVFYHGAIDTQQRL